VKMKREKRMMVKKGKKKARKRVKEMIKVVFTCGLGGNSFFIHLLSLTTFLNINHAVNF